MKNLVSLLLLVALTILTISGSSFAQNELLLKNVLRDSGTITGLVYCPNVGEPASGAMVYLEGLSFSAITGDSGEFTLIYVPAGSHRLVVNYQDELHIYDVTVTENSTFHVGELAVDCAF